MRLIVIKKLQYRGGQGSSVGCGAIRVIVAFAWRGGWKPR